MTPVFDPSTQLGYLETIGRVSGELRETEIWFAYEANTIAILSGGGLDKDWVKNARQQPRVRFRIGSTWLTGTLRFVTDPDEDTRARRIVAGKYYAFDPNGDDPLPNEWSRTATPVAIDLD